MVPVVHRSRSTARRGIAVVEFAIILPLLLLLLVGVWEIGRMLEAHQILSNAAREGGRQASTGFRSSSEVEKAVREYLTNAGLPTENVKVAIEVKGNAKADAASAAQLEELAVTVTMPVKDVVWYTLELFTPMDGMLQARSAWYSLKNKDYPSPSDPPIDY
jgi:Flp pilus assembly protein TadG